MGGNGAAGAAHVLYGTSEGLDTDNDQFWSQESPEVKDAPDFFDQFGFGLAAGDFDNDGRDDLAIGARGETVSGQSLAGAVNVLYGTANGLRATGNQFWHQNSPGILDEPEEEDGFGSALTSGDYDGDGFDDLAVAARVEDINGVEDCGAVNIIYGTAAGLKKTGNQFWHQDSSGIVDTAAAEELFGVSVR